MLVKKALPFESTFDSYKDAVQTYNFDLKQIAAQMKPRPKPFKRNARSAQDSSRPQSKGAQDSMRH
jgi:hypothetical protein